MKKTLGIFVLVFVFLASITTAYCSDTEYKIPELYMTVTVPDDYTVFTRDIAEDDAGLAKFGFDAASLKKLYEQGNIYLNAVSADAMEEVVVTMVTNSDMKKAFNLKRASQGDIDKFLLSLDSEFSKMGAKLNNTSQYEHGQALFIVTDFAIANDTMNSASKMYSTLINGQFINFTLHSYSGTFTNAEDDILKQIVDSAVFVEQSSFDWTYVIVCGIVGAIGGGTIGLIRNRQKKKLAAIAAQSSASEPPVSE